MALKLTRDFYIPKAPNCQVSAVIRPKNSDAEVYLYTFKGIAGRFFATGFRSKKTIKSNFNYSFKTEESREKYVRNFLENCAAVVTRREENRTRRNQAERGLEIGDILYASWGYEQTNIDFYQVVSLKGKQTVVIRKISQAITEESGPMSEKVIALKDNFIGEPLNRRARNGAVSVDEVRYASKWDGRPKYQSHCH